ncbi:hypothetical protein FHS57_000528 [Runella defluvii]|uniref:Uncharacterized protein n=1 Tax=Runella defluvii TaxID=370973 RepID=A0A7W5ZIU4_9BACT|nr:hypothetical protein [Runella defluvii]MBB3836546.1 hypothetical protein [Runella defluvii]
MKTFTSPEHFTFTNHFNQSLLKSRIAMMNKRKSSWKAFGKYGLFIASIWMSAAFTKPYREEVQKIIVQKVPELETVFTSTQTSPIVHFYDFKLAPAPVSTAEIASTALSDTLFSKTPYVVFQNNRLYWVLTPKCTLQDLANIQDEFRKIGWNFSVDQIKFDPLSHFITAIDLTTTWAHNDKKSQCQSRIDDTNKPIAITGGSIEIAKNFCSAGRSYAAAASLAELTKKDEQEVNHWIHSHRYELLKREYQARIKAITQGKKVSFSEFKESGFNYLCQTGARNQIYFSPEKQLRIESFYREALFIIDNQTSTLEDAEKLTINNLYAVHCYAWYDDENSQIIKRAFAIFTNQSPILP